MELSKLTILSSSYLMHGLRIISVGQTLQRQQTQVQHLFFLCSEKGRSEYQPWEWDPGLDPALNFCDKNGSVIGHATMGQRLWGPGVAIPPKPLGSLISGA